MHGVKLLVYLFHYLFIYFHFYNCICISCSIMLTPGYWMQEFYLFKTKVDRGQHLLELHT